MTKQMDFNIGDKIKFVGDAAFGAIKKGSTGVIRRDFGDAVLIKLMKVVGDYKPSTYYMSLIEDDADNIKVTGVDLSVNNDRTNLGDDIRGEKLAIGQYQDHINATTDSEIKSKLMEIKKEEEHHAEELAYLLTKKCPNTYAKQT